MKGGGGGEGERGRAVSKSMFLSTTSHFAVVRKHEHVPLR